MPSKTGWKELGGTLLGCALFLLGGALLVALGFAIWIFGPYDTPALPVVIVGCTLLIVWAIRSSGRGD